MDSAEGNGHSQSHSQSQSFEGPDGKKYGLVNGTRKSGPGGWMLISHASHLFRVSDRTSLFGCV